MKPHTQDGRKRHVAATEKLDVKIRNRIWLLRAEFEEIRTLKQMADELKSLRKKAVFGKCD